MAEKIEYYEFLGVSRNCNDRELKTAYRRLAMQYHPDRNSAPDAEDKFKQASEAYQVLSDPQKRAAYDRFGHAGVSGEPSPWAASSPEDQIRTNQFWASQAASNPSWRNNDGSEHPDAYYRNFGSISAWNVNKWCVGAGVGVLCAIFAGADQNPATYVAIGLAAAVTYAGGSVVAKDMAIGVDRFLRDKFNFNSQSFPTWPARTIRRALGNSTAYAALGLGVFVAGAVTFAALN